MKVCTPRIILWSVVTTRRTEPLQGVLLVGLDKNQAMTELQRSCACKCCHEWRNLRSLSKKPTRRIGNITVARKVTVTLTLPEALGMVVLRKLHVIVRNSKLILN